MSSEVLPEPATDETLTRPRLFLMCSIMADCSGVGVKKGLSVYSKEPPRSGSNYIRSDGRLESKQVTRYFSTIDVVSDSFHSAG